MVPFCSSINWFPVVQGDGRGNARTRRLSLSTGQEASLSRFRHALPSDASALWWRLKSFVNFGCGARDTLLRAFSALVKVVAHTLLQAPLVAPSVASDWPASAAIDLGVHDLPHASSDVETWRFHTHLTNSDGHAFTVVAAFSRVVKGVDATTGQKLYSPILNWSVTDVHANTFFQDSLLDSDSPACTYRPAGRLPVLVSRMACVWSADHLVITR